MSVTAPAKSLMTLTQLSDREVMLSRPFDAPRALVWEAMTKVEHIPHWYGCYGTVVTKCVIDLRVGGKWRYDFSLPDGSNHAMGGVYREINAPARLVSTEHYQGPVGDPSPDAIVVMTLEERGSGTLWTSRVAYPSPEILQIVLNMNMEKGAGETMDRLDAHLRTIS